MFTVILILLSFFSVPEKTLGGPTPKELVKLLDQCEISQSQNSTPCISPSPSIMAGSIQRPNLDGLGSQLGDSIPPIDGESVEEGEAMGGATGVSHTQVTYRF
mgnify:FL=1